MEQFQVRTLHSQVRDLKKMLPHGAHKPANLSASPSFTQTIYWFWKSLGIELMEVLQALFFFFFFLAPIQSQKREKIQKILITIYLFS